MSRLTRSMRCIFNVGVRVTCACCCVLVLSLGIACGTPVAGLDLHSISTETSKELGGKGFEPLGDNFVLDDHHPT